MPPTDAHYPANSKGSLLLSLILPVLYFQDHHDDIEHHGEQVGKDDGQVFFSEAVISPQGVAGKHHEEHEDGNISCFLFPDGGE